MIATARLQEMKRLLEAMGNRTKLSTDGLGIYLGDGLPRPGMGNLRSNELKAVIEELLELRACQSV